MSFFADVFDDVKKDLAKSAIIGGITLIASAILMMIAKELPSELKVPYILILFVVVITFTSLLILLTFRTDSNIIRKKRKKGVERKKGVVAL